MRRGRRLRAVAARLFDAKTMARVVDVPNLPALDGPWLGGAAWYPELALAVIIVLLTLTHRRQAHVVAG